MSAQVIESPRQLIQYRVVGHPTCLIWGPEFQRLINEASAEGFELVGPIVFDRDGIPYAVMARTYWA